MTLINNFDGLLNADNASGAPWFQVVLPEDVDTMPDTILDQIGSAITLNGGATAFNIMATVGTVQWTEAPQQVDGRQMYRSVFSFIIPKDRADVLTYAKHLNNRGVIAIVRDANGQSRLMGTVDEPATFRLATRTLGNAEGQRNEHQYEIVLTSANPVPFYQVSSHLPAPANVCPPPPSLLISVSNETPVYGETVTVTVSASGITPTSYSFTVEGNITTNTTVQAGNVFTYVVNTLNPVIHIQATDGSYYTATVYNSFTVSSITEAGTFITALETLTSDTMEGRQKDAVNRLVWMLKGNDTTNSTDLWTLLTATNAAWYIYCPNDDSTAYFDGYKIDLLDPTHTGTFINMVAGDISVEGVKGGSGKALNMDVQPADFDLNSIMCHCYLSKYGFEYATVPMGVHLTTQSTDGVSAFWQFNSTQAVVRVNNGGGGSFFTKQSITGVMSFGRDNGTQVKTATNGNYDGTGTAASSSAIAEDFYAHCANNASTGVPFSFSALTYAGFSVTPWLSADEYLDFCQAWDEFNKIVITDGRKCNI